MDNTFFTLIKPLLNKIDNGELFRKPFSWLYIALAILSLIYPFIILSYAVKEHVFDNDLGVLFMLIWVFTLFAGWISFQLWWDRKNVISKLTGPKDHYVATPVFGHFVQTLGEMLGLWVAIVGFGISLVAGIFFSDRSGASLFYSLDMDFLYMGWAGIIIMPIIGFIIIVITRYLAELITTFASIANNTGISKDLSMAFNLSPEEAEPEPEQENICNNCGAVLDDEALFCTNCGSKVR